MLYDEIDPNAVNRLLTDWELDRSSKKPSVVTVKEASFTWENPETPALVDIDFTVRQGALLAIVGPLVPENHLSCRACWVRWQSCREK